MNLNGFVFRRSHRRELAPAIEVIDAEVAEVVDPRAQLRFAFARHSPGYSSGSSDAMSFGTIWPTTNVTRPWLISSCATRQAFMLLVGISGSAPDCNCRALRAAPFTRLYLLWRGSSIDIVNTSGDSSNLRQSPKFVPPRPHVDNPSHPRRCSTDGTTRTITKFA